MLKLIRACIGAKSDWDLWFNREPPGSPAVIHSKYVSDEEGEEEEEEPPTSQLVT
jgi:hypothetical protein